MENYYFHQGHTWVKVLDTAVVLGLDEFTQRFLGPIDQISCPNPRTRVKKGERIWTIKFNGRSLAQVSPISGIILEVNERVLENPALLNQSPYVEGWILKILPTALGDEINELCRPSNIMRWNYLAKETVLRHFLPDPQMTHEVYGDGGELVPGSARLIEESKWDEITKRIFQVK